MSDQMRIRREPNIESLMSLAEQWDALDKASFPRTPFSSSAWNLLWWKHFSESSLLVRDRLFAYSIWDADGKLCGIAPMMITEQPGAGPVKARRLQFFGADANVTEIRGLICSPDKELTVVRTLRDELRKEAKHWDFMLWQGLRSPEAIEELQQMDGVVVSRVVPDYYVQPGENFKTNLPRNIKESLRKCYNSLKRDGHEFEFRVLEKPSEVREALGPFFDLHSARAKLENTIKHGDVFASPLARTFVSDVMEELARRGQAKVFQLVIGSEVVASRLGFAWDDQVYLYFSGYVPEWGKYSVMTTTLWEIIQYAGRAGYKTINLSPGNDVSKTRWRPLEQPITSLVWPAPTWRGPRVYRIHSEIEKARANPKFSKVLRLIRRNV